MFIPDIDVAKFVKEKKKKEEAEYVFCLYVFYMWLWMLLPSLAIYIKH